MFFQKLASLTMDGTRRLHCKDYQLYFVIYCDEIAIIGHVLAVSASDSCSPRCVIRSSCLSVVRRKCNINEYSIGLSFK